MLGIVKPDIRPQIMSKFVGDRLEYQPYYMCHWLSFLYTFFDRVEESGMELDDPWSNILVTSNEVSGKCVNPHFRSVSR